jgi:hypothetical protein
VNGELFASGMISPHSGDPVTALQFFTTPLDWSNDIIIAGYAQGSIKIWTIVKDMGPPSSPTKLAPRLGWKLHGPWATLQHPDTRQISSMLMGKNRRFILQGDANGQVRSWTFMDGSATEVHFENVDKCRTCQTKGN